MTRPDVTAEDGFTLVELLVASLIGMIVLFSGFALVEYAMKGQRTVENRLDSTDYARRVMEQLTRQLRAQVCLGKGVAPVLEATSTKVTFYASVGPEPATASARQRVQKRTLEYVPTGDGRGKIVETVVDGDDTPPPNTKFIAAPRTRTIGGNIALIDGTPLFTYFKYDPNDSPAVQQLSPPISAENRQIIVQIKTAFDVYPTQTDAAEDRVKTRMVNKVTVRTADPTDPTRSPKCI